jgi:hypothetical protein
VSAEAVLLCAAFFLCDDYTQCCERCSDSCDCADDQCCFFLIHIYTADSAAGLILWRDWYAELSCFHLLICSD